MNTALLHTGNDVQSAAQEIINKVHAYMRAHPDSELHRCGKMFGVLIVKANGRMNKCFYLAAFSSMLDGSYLHEGFVPPVAMGEGPNGEWTNVIGHSREESQRLQRLLFAQYNLLNGRGESKNLLEIFANEKPIFSEDQWFSEKKFRVKSLESGETLPPSGAGECCAPKLLQFAFANRLQPVALGEFWIGAAPKNELRREGVFYPPCSGRCVPILRWMLSNGETLRIEGVSDERMSVEGMRVEILFEDEWLIVANKPAGLLTVPGKSNEPSLASILSDERDIPILPAHRLDQDTSGLVVLAKTPEVYKTLQAYFQRRDILKRYEAVLMANGRMAQSATEAFGRRDEGVISLPLLPNPFDRPRQMVDTAHGKPAITRYVIREHRADGTCFVDFYPQTGRTHQLRVHAAHPDGLDAPIVGDRLYGEASPPLPKGKGIQRMLLHAAEIQFIHPVTKEEMHFCIPSGF